MKVWYFCVQIFLKILLIPLTKLFFKIEVVGRENAESAEGPLIITPNHKSFIDHFLIGVALPFNLRMFPIRSMAHQEQMDRMIIGPGIKILGGFAAKSKGKNLDELFEVPEKILKENGIILLYPEAKINRDECIIPIKTGAAELGLRTSAKYLPVAISGLDNFYLKELFICLFIRRIILIRFGSIYSADRYLKRKELTTKIENEIKILYNPDYNKHFKNPY